MDTKEKIRERVREMKLYYTNLVVYGFVATLCLVIWIATGGGHFWPIWVFLGLGASAILQGARLGQMKVLEDYFPFLKSDWEEEQIRLLSKKEDNKHHSARDHSAIPHAAAQYIKAHASKKAPAKTQSAPKQSVQKKETDKGDSTPK